MMWLAPPLAAVVVIPPPAQADTRRLRLSWGAGLGLPEGLHTGLWGRSASLEASLVAGSWFAPLPLITAAGRWFLPAPFQAFSVGAGASLPLRPSLETALGFFDAGWRWQGAHGFLDLAVGPNPVAWGPGGLQHVPEGLRGLPRLRVGGAWTF